jgi:hypothetical protein
LESLAVIVAMVVVVIKAVNAIITLSSHHDDCSFGFQNEEKEQREYFLIWSFSRRSMIWITMMMHMMIKVLSDTVEHQRKSVVPFPHDDKLAETAMGTSFPDQIAQFQMFSVVIVLP